MQQADKEVLIPNPQSLALSLPLSWHNGNKMAALGALAQCESIV